MNEENFSDSSFVNYLIDNINKALIDTETDMNEYLTEIKEKLMKRYIKELKKSKKKQSTMNLFKNLATMLKKSSVRIDSSSGSKQQLSKVFESEKSIEPSSFMKLNMSDSSQGNPKVVLDKKKLESLFDPKVLGEKPGLEPIFNPLASIFKPKKFTDLQPPTDILEVGRLSSQSNKDRAQINANNPFFNRMGLTKLAEISSGDDPNSKRLIEMYYKSPELGNQEGLDQSQYKYPEITSIVSKELDVKSSERKINFDLISLPDRKDYLGSWKILLKLKNDDHFQDNISAEFYNSDRHLNRKELTKFLEDIDNPRPTSNHVIKVIATHTNESQSNASWLYSDSSASQNIKLNIMDTKGQSVPIVDEEQIRLYKKLYQDIIEVERGEVQPQGDTFPLDFNPREAMVVLNESFKLGESQSLRDSFDHGGMLGALEFNEKSFIPKMTLRGYTRKITKQPTMFSRGSVFNEDKSRRTSKTPDMSRKQSVMQTDVRKTPKRTKLEPSASKKKFTQQQDNSGDFSLSGHSEDMMALESEPEDQDKVKVVLNLSRELWMSLRMAPVLSYAPQIKENIEALGFKIKFIEDLVVMNEEYKGLIARKIEQMNDKSVNNMRISRFNKMGLKKLKTVDNRNLPPDRRAFNATDNSISANTFSIEQKVDPLALMNRFQTHSPAQSFRMVSYYNVSNPIGPGVKSIYYKNASGKDAQVLTSKQGKPSNVRGEIN